MAFYDTVEAFLKSGKQLEPPVQVCAGDCLSFWTFKSGAVPKERACAQLQIDVPNRVLHAIGALEDSDIYSDVTQHNEDTWRLGDVFEFFFQTSGHTDYHELHVTPNLLTLQLHISDYLLLPTLKKADMICDCQLHVQTELRHAENLWFAKISVPFESLDLTPDLLTGSRFAFGRYNYNHGNEQPELSASQVFSKSFHTPPLWHELEGLR